MEIWLKIEVEIYVSLVVIVVKGELCNCEWLSMHR